MTYKLTIAGLAVFVLFTPCRAGAQKNSGTIRTISGCIHRGEARDKYKLDAKDGAVWDIDNKSQKVNVGAHVGHMVTVIGKVEHDPYAGKDHKLDANVTGLLDVRKITTVGKVCAP